MSGEGHTRTVRAQNILLWMYLTFESFAREACLAYNLWPVALAGHQLFSVISSLEPRFAEQCHGQK